MVDQLCRVLAPGVPHRGQDARLGDPAEIVVHRRRPASFHHVELRRPGEPVGMRQCARPTVPGFMHGVDRRADAMGEQTLARVVVGRRQRVPEIGGFARQCRRPALVPDADRLGRLGLAQSRRLRPERHLLEVEFQAGVLRVGIEDFQAEGVQRGQERDAGLFTDGAAQRKRAMCRQFGHQPVGDRLHAIVFFRLGLRLRIAVDGLAAALDPYRPGSRIVVVGLGSLRGIGLRRGRDRQLVLGPHIAAFDPYLALAVDADEGAGAGDFRRIEHQRPQLHAAQRLFDLGEALLDGLGDFVMVGILLFKLVVLRPQRFARRLFLGRQRHLLAPDLAQPEGVAIRKIERDLDPAPAFGPDRIRLAFQPLGDQPRNEGHVLQPAAVVALEQVAHDGAAGRLVRLADEARPLVRRAYGALGQQPPDREGLAAVGGLQPFPDLLLALVISRDGEDHQLVQRHAVLGIDIEQPGRDRGQPQPLFHDRNRHEEIRRDLLLGLPLLAQGQEGAELVERVQRRALDVLGQGVLLGDAFGADDAGDRRGLRQALLPDQQLQRPEAPAAGGHLEHPSLDTLRVHHRSHGEGLQQSAAADVGREFLDGDPRLDPAHIRLAEHQLVEGDVARDAERDLLDGACHVHSPRRAGRASLWPEDPSRSSRPISSFRERRAAKQNVQRGCYPPPSRAFS